MATAPRQQIGSPQIFQTDRLEQELAKVAYGDNPATAGYAMGGLINARAERGMDQDTYLANLHDANAMSYALAQQDAKNDLTKEALGQLANVIGKGVDPSEVPIIGQLFANATASSGPQGAAGLHRALLAAQAEEARQKAAHAGDAGAPTYTIARQYGTYGEEGGQVTGKGRDPRQVEQTVSNTVGAQLGRPPVRVAQPAPNAPGTPGGAAQSFVQGKY